MNKPYNYTPDVFSCLYPAAPGQDIIPYIEIGKARKEYWWASDGRSYTYGTAPFERSYQSSQVVIPEIDVIAKQLADFSDLYGCFINYYNDQRNSLGWHSDDSTEIDRTKSLYVVSFGQPRVIQFMPIGGGIYKASRLNMALS